MRGYVEASSGGDVRKEGSTLRVNPCPLCYHKDCFTIYPANNTFHCFSCERSGSIIDFEMFMKKIDSALEAAKSVAEKMGIREEGGGAPRKGRNRKDRPKPGKTGSESGKTGSGAKKEGILLSTFLFPKK